MRQRDLLTGKKLNIRKKYITFVRLDEINSD